MSEQSKIDAERAAFQAYLLDCREHDLEPDTASAFRFAYARASLPLGVPDGLRDAINRADEVLAALTACTNPLERLKRNHGADWSKAVDDIRRELLASLAAAPAAPTVKESLSVASAPDVLFDGFAVLSALSDKARARTSAQNVSDVLDAVVKLIRDESAPTVKAEQVQCSTCNDTALIGDLPIECPDCCHDEAPSLPAAGSAVEEVEVVGWRDPSLNWSTISADNKAAHLDGESWRAASVRTFTEPLMTVAQHERIVAALSAQQSAPDAPERVSVTVELLDRAVHWLRQLSTSKDSASWRHADELRALLASHAEGGKV